MGTTSETHFVDDQGRTCAVLWRAVDGNPTAHGADLQEFLGTCRLVNGLFKGPECGSNPVWAADEPRCAVGMPCLAAQAVAFFKAEKPGYFYLQPPEYYDLPANFRYTACVDSSGTLSLRCEVPTFDTDVDWNSPPGVPVPHSWHVLYDGPAGSFDPEDAEQTAWDEYEVDDNAGLQQ
jgi:hypothetical protein